MSVIAVGGFVPGTVATAQAQEGDDQDFSPDITINDNNLVATIGERDDGVDPDTVTIYTADGDEHEFDGAAPNDWQAGEAFEVGYTHDQSRARIEGWHGVITRVSATKDGQTVSATNDGESTLEVTCSLWKTPDQPPTEFEVLSEGARKQHFSRGEDDLSADQRQYGSPGRPLKTVAERNREIAMRVDFEGCTPETEKALRFDCTSVTVEPEELNQGEDRIQDVQLQFADGTFESPSGSGDGGGFELPVTLSGSGDNAGKVVERLEFKAEGGEYTYWNLEVDQCSSQQNGGSDDGDDGSDDGNAGDDGGTNDDGTETNDDGTETNDDGDGSSDGSSDDSGSQGPGTDSDSGGDGSSPSGDSTESQGDDSDDGSGGSSGNGSGGSSTTSSGDEDSGGLLDSDSDDATETPTPSGSDSENVTVNGTDRTSGANDTGTANGSGTSGNGSTGGENGSASGNSDPGIATGTPADDQAGLGFAAGLGGLLGFGEFARRKLGVDDEE